MASRSIRSPSSHSQHSGTGGPPSYCVSPRWPLRRPARATSGGGERAGLSIDYPGLVCTIHSEVHAAVEQRLAGQNRNPPVAPHGAMPLFAPAWFTCSASRGRTAPSATPDSAEGPQAARTPGCQLACDQSEPSASARGGAIRPGRHPVQFAGPGAGRPRRRVRRDSGRLPGPVVADRTSQLKAAASCLTGPGAGPRIAGGSFEPGPTADSGRASPRVVYRSRRSNHTVLPPSAAGSTPQRSASASRMYSPRPPCSSSAG